MVSLRAGVCSHVHLAGIGEESENEAQLRKLCLFKGFIES